MNDHETIVRKLPMLAAGCVDADELRQIQQHTASCESCRREVEQWDLYAQHLRRLPQPMVPPGLIERTQARMLEAVAARTARRNNALLLAALAAFGWASSLGLWAVVNLVAPEINAVMWTAAGTALAWLTAGSAIVGLGHHRLRRLV